MKLFNHKPIINVPFMITFIRIVLVPIMWYFALQKNQFLVGILLICAGITDGLDGFFARYLKQETKFGSVFDSFADKLIIISLIFFVFLLMPEIFLGNKIAVSTTIIFVAISLLYGPLVIGKIPALHLISAKVASIVTYIFFVHALLFNYSKIILYITIVCIIATVCEELLILIFKNNIKQNTKSIFTIWKNKHSVKRS